MELCAHLGVRIIYTRMRTCIVYAYVWYTRVDVAHACARATAGAQVQVG